MCVAVTRGGDGDPWLFGDPEEAWSHPLVQYGDVVLTDGASVLRQYAPGELRHLVGFLGATPREVRARRVFNDYVACYGREGRSEAEECAGDLYESVKRAAKYPPATLDALLVQVCSDRRAQQSAVVRIGRSAGDPAPPREGEVCDMTEKRDIFRMADEGVITFGKDGEGKAYGPDNVPKRSDSTKDLFGKYRSGMTVKQALDAGLTRSNVRRDRRAGFIQIENPPEAPKEPKPKKGTKAEGEAAAAG